MSNVKKWEEFRCAENSFGEKKTDFFSYADSEYFDPDNSGSMQNTSLIEQNVLLMS